MPQHVFSPGTLAGRVALITGGGTGIGFAIASGFVEVGVKVILASRKLDQLNIAVEKLRRAGGTAMAVQADVRNYEEVEASVKAATDTYGGLDIMIANAAGNFFVPTAEMSPNAWKAVIEIDLSGTFHCARAAYQALRGSRFGGRLIAISTTRGLEGWPGCAHAGAAKAGIISLMRTLASEWGPDGIRCNTVNPGAIGNTEGVKRLYEDRGVAERELASIPLGTFGDSGDIAQAVIYLCSDAGAYVNGCDLVVDGGRSRRRASVPLKAGGS